ncbi:hypothetical protein AAC387_Pa04g2965 [Persea americana]
MGFENYHELCYPLTTEEVITSVGLSAAQSTLPDSFSSFPQSNLTIQSPDIFCLNNSGCSFNTVGVSSSNCGDRPILQQRNNNQFGIRVNSSNVGDPVINGIGNSYALDKKNNFVPRGLFPNGSSLSLIQSLFGAVPKIKIMAQNDNLDYFDIAEFDDNPFEEEYQSHSVEYSDLEDDDMNMNKQSGDTSAVEARNGKDIQGIPWERMNFSREKYREMRLKQYKNYQNLSYSPEKLQEECKEVEKGGTFFDFQFNTRLVKSTIVHFQEGEGSIFVVFISVLMRCSYEVLLASLEVTEEVFLR